MSVGTDRPFAYCTKFTIRIAFPGSTASLMIIDGLVDLDAGFILIRIADL